MQLQFEINNQQLERKDTNIIVNQTVNHVECQFEFKTSEWTGADKYAIFTDECEKSYCLDLGTTNIVTCNVPGKALEKDFFRVTVFAINNDERITTTEKTVLLDRSGFVSEFEPVDPDESGDIFSST